MTQTPETLSDPAVPGLTFALHSDSLFELLSSRLDECREGLRFLEGRAVDVQYTPGAGAQVLWKIKMSDPETGRTGRQLLFVRALRADEPMPPEPADLIARYRALRASRGMARRMPLRTPWVAVTGAHVVVHAFPLDPALPSLLTVTSPEAMKVALQHAWQVRGARVRRVHVDTLSYTPGARAALEYEILAENQTTQLPELRRLVGKIDVRREPARLFAGHWAVWRKTFGRVSIAPPVGYIAVARLSLQEFVTGTRLSDITAQGEMVGRARKAARAIASVHALNLPVLKHRSVEKEMTSVERWVGVLSQLRPAQAERLESLSNRVRREMADRMRVSATVHADFHLANILADRQGVTLIDWDQAAHGDAMLDVGRLLASLRVSSLRMHNTLDGLSAVEEGFLQAYLEHTGDNEQRARLFEAASLLTAAATPFRLQREGWQEDADRMIDEVDRVLSLSMKGSQVAGTSHEFKREVPFTDRAGWAMDRVYAQALLVPVIQAAYGADIELTETAPSIKKSTLSALHARWMIKGYRGRERWRRTVDAVGFSTSSGRNVLHRWRTAFYAAAERPSVLQIPRPLGRIGPLSMVVFERARGAPLHKLLGGPDEAVAMDQLGRALAEFHSLDMSLAKSRNSGRCGSPRDDMFAHSIMHSILLRVPRRN